MKAINLTLLLAAAALSVLGQGSHRNEDKARLIFQAFNEHDWDLMLSYYSKEAVFEDPSFERRVSDPVFIKEHHRELQAYFEDIKDDVKHVYSCGDVVVVEFISHGTGKNGEKLAMPICTVLTFRDGLVIRDATYYNDPK
jgi:ketosteroid isomerase-like protein